MPYKLCRKRGNKLCATNNITIGILAALVLSKFTYIYVHRVGCTIIPKRESDKNVASNELNKTEWIWIDRKNVHVLVHKLNQS